MRIFVLFRNKFQTKEREKFCTEKKWRETDRQQDRQLYKENYSKAKEEFSKKAEKDMNRMQRVAEGTRSNWLAKDTNKI